MMSIDAVFPAIGGIGMRLMGTVVTFADTSGSAVGAGVAPTGRLACAGATSAVCVVHWLGLGAVVALAKLTEAVGAVAGVPLALQAAANTATMRDARVWRTETFMSSSQKQRIVSSRPSSPQPA